jgi:hypothetical protein
MVRGAWSPSPRRISINSTDHPERARMDTHPMTAGVAHRIADMLAVVLMSRSDAADPSPTIVVLEGLTNTSRKLGVKDYRCAMNQPGVHVAHADIVADILVRRARLLGR